MGQKILPRDYVRRQPNQASPNYCVDIVYNSGDAIYGIVALCLHLIVEGHNCDEKVTHGFLLTTVN